MIPPKEMNQRMSAEKTKRDRWRRYWDRQSVSYDKQMCAGES